MQDEFVDGDPFDPEYVTVVAQKQQIAVGEAETEAVRELRVRQEAYRRMFNGADRETRRIVLADLNKFCRGTSSTFHDNERLHCLLTGRNEVYQRIADNLRLTLDALVERYTEPRG